ncbi:arabinan endo-1,5-alpha-L-arabinosidase [Pseudoduganella flava]|uniref:Arabinan endo-1,5-alpha-L-arabinosidase n=1 Tax=Pseudoduganella flava TaxID=871742 RepID=A0A562PBP6_9BURK|nr:family 43 glycosylhydrolase [Pseudoduganella flava]TWI41844.1 arabinan endo-1,5-alpha-L-arabinosidase [Pseudoduganella flava]
MRACLFLAAAVFCAAAAQAQSTSTYRNPLPVRLPGGAPAQNCADPAVLRDPRAATPTWYLYCTTDPVSHAEREPGEQGGWKFRLMPIYRSQDLVHWDYVADAFADRPPPAAPKAGLWAPEPHYHDGRYWLYYTITDVVDVASPEPGCDNDSAIGVAVADSPAGPWRASPKPVVPPRRVDGATSGCKFDWTFDPDVVTDTDGTRYLYYGSYGGGIFVQRLAADGLSVEGEPRQVGTSWRYEGAEVVRHDGMWYLFASATDCCAGPLTGYALHVGRAVSPLGPFLDRHGEDMAAVRAGGTPVLPQNGNRWTGPGHNTVFQDAAGQWWTMYHAIDLNEPFFAPGLTRRVALLDRVDWVGGWPIVAGGGGPSDELLPAPAATADAPARPPVRVHGSGADLHLLWRDDFAKPPAPPWRWIRDPGTWQAGARGLAWSTQPGDLHVDTNSAPLLARPLPAGDVRIETRVRLDAPDDCCASNAQAGLVALGDDDNYVKLVVLAGRGLHQVEFAKEQKPVPAGYPRYGNTVAGTPAGADGWTWLRLDVRRAGGLERWTAWSSQDGRDWVGGGTWTHQLGAGARLALAAMGGGGRAATFGPVTVSRLGPAFGAAPGLQAGARRARDATSARP